MGIEKLWTKSRADRLRDPDILRALGEERDRVKESLKKLGDQTKETCSAIVYDALVRPFTRIKKGKQREFNPAKQVMRGAANSTGETLLLVSRILMASGRVAKYGIRKGLVI